MSENKLPKQEIDRRTFLMNAVTMVGVAVAGIVSIPVIGAFFQPLFRKRESRWVQIGKVSDYKPNTTVLIKFKNEFSSETAAWLQCINNKTFAAYSINCTHLGCPVRWMPDAEIFLCPCHGGVYNKDGSYAAGPPPKNLKKYPIRIMNSNIEISTYPVPML